MKTPKLLILGNARHGDMVKEKHITNLNGNIMNKNKNTNTPKLLIIGSARHGKDTFAELMAEYYGLNFQSSSQAAADIFIYDKLRIKYGYETSEECFEDRINHRPEWHQLICDYNEDDRARLAKGILEDADCYVGMRDHQEIVECMNQGLFDLIIWVDGSGRLPLEPSESFNIDISCADIIIENNGTLDEFKGKVKRIGRILMNHEPKVINEIPFCFCEHPRPTGMFNKSFESWVTCLGCGKEILAHKENK